MKSIFSILILGVCLAAGTPGAGFARDIEDGDKLSAAEIAPLLAWVEHKTGVHVPVPPVVIASHTRLLQVVRNAPRTAGIPQSVFLGGTVVLNDRTWDPDDPTQVSLLVHELVHYAQTFMNRSQWACHEQREVQAYSLQNEWLEERGHRPYVSASWINTVSRCSDHPSSSYAAMAEE